MIILNFVLVLKFVFWIINWSFILFSMVIYLFFIIFKVDNFVWKFVEYDIFVYWFYVILIEFDLIYFIKNCMFILYCFIIYIEKNFGYFFSLFNLIF